MIGSAHPARREYMLHVIRAAEQGFKPLSRMQFQALTENLSRWQGMNG